MGSSGSGRISDYPGSSRAGGSGSGPKGDGGGQSSDDRCEKAFNTSLEDVEHSEYFETHGAPPPVGEQLQIRQTKRLVAVTIDGQSVGNIPTALNYLASCMKDGWNYTGRVTASDDGPSVVSVMADFAATSPA